MTPELIGILGVGAALAAVTFTGLSGINKRLDGFDKRLDGFDKRLDGFDQRLRSLEAGLAELRGEMRFMRDYITGRNVRNEAPGDD